MERRLAAILAADVVGYSRLIRADEEGTLVRLKALRTALIDPGIAAHNGRIVKLMGDGMLVEFASVVDAVRTAAEMQLALAERNAVLPEEQRIALRVGINLGDVVIDGDDIYGDGVNVAARLGTVRPQHRYSDRPHSPQDRARCQQIPGHKDRARRWLCLRHGRQLTGWMTKVTGASRVVDPLVAFDCRSVSSDRVGTHFVLLGEGEQIFVADKGSTLIAANRAYG